MKRFAILLGSFLAFASQPILAQMDASIKLNEVMTQNESSLIDEYGVRNAWVEIANISHSWYVYHHRPLRIGQEDERSRTRESYESDSKRRRAH